MRDEKGITFKYTTEDEAKAYLTNINNYLRTFAYCQNYQKHTKGPDKGKYIDLDFAYLQELSTIDMHFRFIVSKMCLDIEHAMKVNILADIETDTTTDGYDIVASFLEKNTTVLKSLMTRRTAPFIRKLFQKYFTLQCVYNPVKHKNENQITIYNDCPACVLVEFLTFGEFVNFYEYYYSNRNKQIIPKAVINLVKRLRNETVHNNCILANLKQKTSHVPSCINQMVAQIPGITKIQRKKRLGTHPMLEFVALLYTYEMVVSKKVKDHRIQELKSLFFKRMLEKKDFFEKNELIKSNYKFACSVITYIFP